MDWFETEKELPPKDGKYLMTNDPYSNYYPPGEIVISYYDGYGFMYESAYRNPRFWTYYNEPEKKYGKQKFDCNQGEG